MSRTILYGIVFLAGATPFLESTFVIPLGTLGGLPVPAVTVVSVIGNLLTLLLSVVLADRIGTWLRRRRENKRSSNPDDETSGRKRKKGEKALNLWKKYGLPGLAAIHPVTLGSSHATAALAMSLGASKRAIVLWVGGSVVVWAIGFAVLSHLGAGFILGSVNSDGFLVDLLQGFGLDV